MHKNKINGKIYIGQTIQDPKERWKTGFRKDYNEHLKSAYKKYGKNNFESQVICSVKFQKTANFLEAYYINQFKTLNPNYGYNKTSGGKNFKNLSTETKEKISKRT